ncbi:SDR family oxidoreductase [Streptomyces roseirectus]|uniref:SDR family oxidoreductase n=1 Tax=Streptomyces roseirectus TaxID=2768066 RepID=A0A7H0IQ31_9ACTN|nr:SDR family oxidoreductase [Streptomyces roseirectus]QNP74897.1 SDR family oxidoreductase [Streptomyces roseirectus]
MTARSIAVVGMGVRLPGARDTSAFWELLNRPHDAFSEPGARYRLADFHSPDRRTADRTYSRVAGFIHDSVPPARDEPLEVVWLRDCARQATAGVRVEGATRVSCVVGAWPGGSQALMQSVLLDSVARRLPGQEAEVRRLLAEVLPYARTGCLEAPDAVRAALAPVLSAEPTVWTVDTACSSSLYAIDLAAKQLRTGQSELALCGGVSVLEPTMSVLFSAIGGLSATGRLRALDAAADGTLFSDAAVLLAVKTLARARADGDRVLGVLAGFGGAGDGRGRSMAAPNPHGQARAVRRARQERGLTPDAVDWVVAHATGTRAGDGAEISALSAESPAAGWACTATKSLVGHAGWAAGAASVVHVLLALDRGAIPAQQHFDEPARPLGRLRVPDTPRPWPRNASRPRVAGVSAFGFGGTNGHLLVADPAPTAPAPAPVTWPSSALPDDLVLLAWSARLPGAPDTESVRSWLAGQGPAPDAEFGDEVPDFATVALPAPTVRAVDRAQTLALEVAHRFTAEHGEPWADVRERTGVIAAHSGVPVALRDYALRCHADLLGNALRAHPSASTALDDLLDEVRARTPRAGPDAMPGVLPNVIPSRLAARYDLHGGSICVDTGTTSAATAFSVAAHYLATGELRLALVLAVDAGALHPSRTAAAAAAVPRQGAFLLALARATTAREHGWPVTARLAAPAPIGDDSAGPAGEFHAARDAVRLLASLSTAPGEPPTVRLPGAPPLKPPATAPLTVRHTSTLRPAPWQDTAPPRPAPPRNTLILTDHTPTATDLTRPAPPHGWTVLCTAPDAPRSLRPGTAQDLERAVEQAAGHVRVISRPGAAWPSRPSAGNSTLHEVLFQALRHGLRRRLSGSLGALALCPPDHPHAALLTALDPALLADHPGLPVRVVVCDTTVEDGLDRLAREWHSADAARAVWYVQGQRHRRRLVPAPLPAPGPLPPLSAVVASGGTGGVTTALLTALATGPTPPDVWLLGTTDVSALPAELLTATEAELPSLRAAFIARALRVGTGGVREAARYADRLLAGRRAARHLDRLRDAFGEARVHYLPCDITDADACAAAAREVAARHAGIDLFLHAATRSRTAPLDRKAPADFRLVRDVKILGYHHLRTAFADLDPRLWCNIASVAAVQPLRGEIDYGPANAYLSAVPHHLSTVREITLGFPLWRDSGYFASRPALIGQIVDGGRLTGISDTEGIAHFLAALAPHPTPSGVYLGARERDLMRTEQPGLLDDDPSPQWRRTLDPGQPDTPRSGAFLTSTPRRPGDGCATWDIDLAPDHHTYLVHHTVHGEPTVPGTFLLAAAVEAALALRPGCAPTALLDASFEVFVRPSTTRATRRYTLTAHPGQDPDDDTVLVELHGTTRLRGHVLPRRRHFTVRVAFTQAPATHRQTPRHPTETATPLPPDPYYFADSPVHLTGLFANTRRWRNTPTGPTALWRPPGTAYEDHPVLRRLPLPALLLCATLRTRTLVPDAEQRRDVVAPRRIARIDLPVPANDHTLSIAYPHGITTHHSPAEDTYTALAPDGTLLLRVTGFEGASLRTTRSAGTT